MCRDWSRAQPGVDRLGTRRVECQHLPEEWPTDGIGERRERVGRPGQFVADRDWIAAVEPPEVQEGPVGGKFGEGPLEARDEVWREFDVVFEHEQALGTIGLGVGDHREVASQAAVRPLLTRPGGGNDAAEAVEGREPLDSPHSLPLETILHPSPTVGATVEVDADGPREQSIDAHDARTFRPSRRLRCVAPGSGGEWSLRTQAGPSHPTSAGPRGRAGSHRASSSPTSRVSMRTMSPWDANPVHSSRPRPRTGGLAASSQSTGSTSSAPRGAEGKAAVAFGRENLASDRIAVEPRPEEGRGA